MGNTLTIQEAHKYARMRTKGNVVGITQATGKRLTEDECYEVIKQYTNYVEVYLLQADYVDFVHNL